MKLRDTALGIAAFVASGCGAAPTTPASATAGKLGTAQAADVGVAFVPLRRLTREEYDNTVRDLLGDTSRPARAFPPDEATGGFESNNLAPATEAIIQRYADAAETLAAGARPRLAALAPCAPDEPEARCARSFIDTFGRRAFRRPLADEERAGLWALYEDKAKRTDHAAGLQLTIEAVLQSPQFLYRVEPRGASGAATRPLDDYEMATRLSYFVWASTPDDALLDAAAAGKLTAPADVDRAVRRMMQDPRWTDGLRSFHRQWLGLRELETESKETLPAFTPELRDAMVEETLRFSAHAVLDGGDAVTNLLTSSSTYVNAPLAKLYGVPAPASGFAKVEMPPGQRSGVLTQASVLAVHASAGQTSPILRGKFIREKILCQGIPPPPPNANIAAPKIDPKVTTKQRFAQHRSDPSCAGCHELMDPIGFGFEHYDAIGAWRTKDGAFPVDAVGELSWTDGANGPFDGAVELGARLASSPEVRRCVATQWFRYALGRRERTEEAPSVSRAYDAFATKGFDVRELVAAIATSDAFRHARADEGGGP